MKSLYLLPLLILMAGCGSLEHQSTTQEIYAQLWAKCQQKHLKYKIACPVSPDSCASFAWDADKDFSDGVIDNWSWSGFGDGPTAAASDLVKKLDGGRNNEPLNRPSHYDSGTVSPASK